MAMVASGRSAAGSRASWPDRKGRSVKNFLTNLFHILGILFFVLILYIILSISGFFAAFTNSINVMQKAGH